ncbi:uncharacterized protein LOC135825389 isoform X1 [Sycon ciliatum]|uniref:uncharacterized protein LOC135825389 isoform X1 n=2 Tax=Sycon ciliatum TaxID=27933 RepID=UPI0031F62835
MNHYMIVLAITQTKTMSNVTASEGIVVLPNDPDYLGLCAIIIVAIQTICFIIAATLKFDKLNDLVGGSNFVILAWLTFALAQTYHARQILVSICVTVWGLRLSLFLFYRILKTGEDWRFNDLRVNPAKLSVFWILQAIWVFGTGLPVYIVNSPRTNQGSQDLQPLDYVGLAVFVVGFLSEVIADQQKNSFRNNTANKGKPCTAGLWSWSRHPNYFGEITLWWGIFMMCASAFEGWHWASVESPVVISILLLFVSGIPMLEQNAAKRYAEDPSFWEYRRSTSPVIPMPASVYALLPKPMQFLCCCECPCYRAPPDVEKEPITP